MSWLATPEKASRMMLARCTRRWATVVAVLNLRSTFSCRWLITTFAAEPAMATLLVFPHPGKSAESSKTDQPVIDRFRLPGLVMPSLGVIAQLGVILYMFLVGLELNASALQRRAQAT